MRLSFFMSAAVAGIFIVASCSKPSSNTRGWEYSNTKTGGFQKALFIDQEIGPDLLLV